MCVVYGCDWCVGYVGECGIGEFVDVYDFCDW